MAPVVEEESVKIVNGLCVEAGWVEVAISELFKWTEPCAAHNNNKKASTLKIIILVSLFCFNIYARPQKGIKEKNHNS